MAKRFEAGDVCIVDEALTKNRNESNYVYIKDVLPFNKYRCLPCNYCGEITSFAAPSIIHHKYLCKRTWIPQLSDEDIITCIQVLTVLEAINTDQELNIDAVREVSLDFVALSNKLAVHRMIQEVLDEQPNREGQERISQFQRNLERDLRDKQSGDDDD